MLQRRKASSIARVFILVGSALASVISCKTITTEGGESVKPFLGTIVYDVDVSAQVDTQYIKNKKAFLYGDKMYLTVFRNGDIQRKYNGNSPQGYDLHYINLEENQVLEKYNNSDSLFVHRADKKNIQKMYDLRVDDAEENVLGLATEQIAIGAKDMANPSSAGEYLTMKYWYSPTLRVDKTAYANVNDDLWSYFMNKSDGSLYLKYEIDYFKYKVTYTAIEILPGKFEKSKEELDESAPRVED